MTWMVVGYCVFGLLLMNYMCPLWPFFEKLIGALIWPISLVIGIVILIREAKQDRRNEVSFLEIQMLLIMLKASQTEAQEKDDWTPDRN